MKGGMYKRLRPCVGNSSQETLFFFSPPLVTRLIIPSHVSAECLLFVKQELSWEESPNCESCGHVCLLLAGKHLNWREGEKCQRSVRRHTSCFWRAAVASGISVSMKGKKSPDSPRDPLAGCTALCVAALANFTPETRTAYICTNTSTDSVI